MTDIPETAASQRYTDTKSLLAHLSSVQDIRLQLGEVRAKLSDLRAAIPIWERFEVELEKRLEDALAEKENV